LAQVCSSIHIPTDDLPRELLDASDATVMQRAGDAVPSYNLTLSESPKHAHALGVILFLIR